MSVSMATTSAWWSTAAWAKSICGRSATGGRKVIKRTKPPGRNDACPCGSKLKYKKCCLNLVASFG